jgi:cyclohexa-1,5-dienecarbonyl-CoA hydratase
MPAIQMNKGEQFYTITLDKPPLNILDIELLGELREALGEVANDRWGVIISASGGKAFSAGASVQDHGAERIETMLSLFHDCFRRLYRVEMPTIALVRGAALGGGSELAFACDIVLAAETAQFGYPEIRLGVFPPVGAWQMARSGVPRRGLELILTGESIDAATALQLGLVNAVLPAGEFDAAAARWLEQLTRQSASSLRFAKKAYRLAAGDDFEVTLERIERLYLEELVATADASEGLTAFLEKRKPNYVNR